MIEVKVRLEWLQGQGQMYHAEQPIYESKCIFVGLIYYFRKSQNFQR